MSQFAVLVKRIRDIEPHSNADAIEFAIIDGYRSIVKKGIYRAGDLVAYIPENALLPTQLLKELGFWNDEKQCGTLSGKDGNRVRAIKLRGELSQGVCHPAPHHREGDDVTEELGIQKYEPPIPVSMGGDVFNVGQNLTLSFDVENWKSYPDIIQDGEEVVFTEKLHGTFTGVAVLPLKYAHPDAFGKRNNILIFSKGLGAKGLVFKNTCNNVYVQSTRQLIERIDYEQDLGTNYCSDVNFPVFILGETYGPGVQDLTYGKEIGFRVFSVAEGYRCDIKYYSYKWVFERFNVDFNYKTVPVLYCGPFSKDIMLQYTNGKTQLDADHIREGIVITPIIERFDSRVGRVCLKSVSEKYLMRKNGTEYN